MKRTSEEGGKVEILLSDSKSHNFICSETWVKNNKNITEIQAVEMEFVINVKECIV